MVFVGSYLSRHLCVVRLLEEVEKGLKVAGMTTTLLSASTARLASARDGEASRRLPLIKTSTFILITLGGAGQANVEVSRR